LPATSKSPLIIGHRGASALAPENTLAAFARAFADGADGIEFDTRLARDGVPVVIHDATLARTGNTKRAVAEMPSAELSRANVGSWFNRSHPRLARAEYAQQTVPTLGQVLAILKSSRKRNSVAYLELKIDRGDVYTDLVGSVAELITRHALRRRIVVVSFNLKALALVKELNSAIRTGALFEPRRNPTRIVRKHPMITAALDCGANEILFHRLIATHRLADLAAESNLLPVVWTVDDQKWLARAKTCGIHALITNDPAKMVADPKK
jgi:glycerophosphoryl diester phosphodiesterase